MSPSAYVNVVAADLRSAERAIDQSIAAAAALLTHLDGRAGEDLPASLGHTAIIAMADAVNEGVKMRGRMVQAHARLTEDAQRYGIQLGGWTESKEGPGGQHFASVEAPAQPQAQAA